MKTSILFGFLAFAGTGHALDLTPSHGTRELEGFKIPVIHFKDAERNVRYQPPPKWQISGGGAALSLYPPNRPEAIMKLQVFARKVDVTAALEAEDDLQKWAQQFVPIEATEASLIGKNESPFTLNGLGSREYTFTYLLGGRRFTKSIAFVDLDRKERLALIVSTRANDFEAVHGEAIASMFSWEQAPGS